MAWRHMPTAVDEQNQTECTLILTAIRSIYEPTRVLDPVNGTGRDTDKVNGKPGHLRMQRDFLSLRPAHPHAAGQSLAAFRFRNSENGTGFGNTDAF